MRLRYSTLHATLRMLRCCLRQVTDIKIVRAAGVLLSRGEVRRAAQLCQDAGAWLIMDNTYEHFVYDGRQHHCVAAPHIIHIFSFSKVHSRHLLGWSLAEHVLPSTSL